MLVFVLLLTGALSLNVDVSRFSISGISSGADLVVQMQVAYSSRVLGTAVFAGQPYSCAVLRLVRVLPISGKSKLLFFFFSPLFLSFLVAGRSAQVVCRRAVERPGSWLRLGRWTSTAAMRGMS
jgi:poly(3-hydroxybutyrate) depolymerase